jgi:membrane-associated phospholipid phosphatase
MRTLALLCAALAAFPSIGRAQASDVPKAALPSPTSTRPLFAGGNSGARALSYDLKIDGGVVILTGGAYILTEILKENFAPARCVWCARNGMDDAVTNALGWSDIKLASTISNVVGYAATPLAAVGVLSLAAGKDGHLDEMWVNALLMVEAVAVSSALNQAVKFTAGRERPFVAELSPEAKARTAEPADNNLSFYSGHSNLVFALAVSAGTLAHMRGYEYEPAVWAVGLPLAGFVAYSRIAAKKHYLTDVLVGSAAGAAIGFALPWFLHRPKSDTGVTVSALPNGAAFTLRFH